MRKIYCSSNEDGLLKSVGPHKLETADRSFSGLIVPQVSDYSSLQIEGQVLVYQPDGSIQNSMDLSAAATDEK